MEFNKRVYLHVAIVPSEYQILVASIIGTTNWKGPALGLDLLGVDLRSRSGASLPVHLSAVHMIHLSVPIGVISRMRANSPLFLHYLVTFLETFAGFHFGLCIHLFYKGNRLIVVAII